MPAIRIGVVDDEVIIADAICIALEQLGYTAIEPAGSYGEAITMIEKERPDLVIVDINLRDEKDGIELAKVIQEKYKIPFIFLTANADAGTVLRAKTTNPPAFLVKPFQKDSLFAAIEISLHNFTKAENDSTSTGSYLLNDAIFIKDGNYFHKVKFSDILYLESDHVYVVVHTREKNMLVRASMQQYTRNFDPKKFFRIHRSFVINLEHLQTINSDHVVINGKSLPVSKNYRDELFSHINTG